MSSKRDSDRCYKAQHNSRNVFTVWPFFTGLKFVLKVCNNRWVAVLTNTQMLAKMTEAVRLLIGFFTNYGIAELDLFKVLVSFSAFWCNDLARFIVCYIFNCTWVLHFWLVKFYYYIWMFICIYFCLCDDHHMQLQDLYGCKSLIKLHVLACQNSWLLKIIIAVAKMQKWVFSIGLLCILSMIKTN